jgi:hypothetical protein
MSNHANNDKKKENNIRTCNGCHLKIRKYFSDAEEKEKVY